MVVVASPDTEEPSVGLTTEEESVASLSPELHPMPMPDDVEGMPLDGTDAHSDMATSRCS